jgi:hypothetical protein
MLGGVHSHQGEIGCGITIMFNISNELSAEETAEPAEVVPAVEETAGEPPANAAAN